MQIEMFYNGAKPDNSVAKITTGVDSKTLVINSVTGRHTGSVSCVAKNDLGIRSKSTYLLVHGESCNYLINNKSITLFGGHSSLGIVQSAYI